MVWIGVIAVIGIRHRQIEKRCRRRNHSLARPDFTKIMSHGVSLPPDETDAPSPLTIRGRFTLREDAESDWLEPGRRLLFESARR
jgi:hypothetical protein